MQSGLVYILQSLADLYLIAVALRLALQWVRADWRNPVVQFVVNITNPLVVPLQKVLAPMYKIDTATLVVYLGIQIVVTALLTSLACVVMPDVLTLVWLAIIRGLRLILNVYFFVIFGYVLMSWISGGAQNPSIAMLGNLLRELASPVLQPVQRYIPPIAGWDLSPIFLLLILGAVTRMLLGPAQQIAGGFMCPLGAIL
jgi:YggT family protein